MVSPMSSRLRLRVVGSGSMPWYISCSPDQFLSHTNLLIPAFSGLDGSWVNTISLQDLGGQRSSLTSIFLDSPPPDAPGSTLPTLWSPNSHRLPVFANLVTHGEQEGLWVWNCSSRQRLPVFRHLCGDLGLVPDTPGKGGHSRVTLELSKPHMEESRDGGKMAEPSPGDGTSQPCASEDRN